MIIERVCRHVAIGVAVLAGWIGVLALGTIVADPARVLVVAPRRIAVSAAVRAGASLVAVHALASDVAYGAAAGPRHGFVRALYAGGAWLVLPRIEGGCLDAKGRGPS